MPHSQNTISASSLLARWVLGSALGFGVGMAGGAGLTLAAEKAARVNPDRLLVYAMLLCLSLAGGFTQSRTAARFLPRPGRWIPATVIGYALALVAFLLPGLLNLSGPEQVQAALPLALMGTAIGVSQWWVLRQHFHGAVVWILASAAGFLSFLWLVAHPAHSLTEMVIVGAVLGGLAAVAPGAALVWFVRRPLAAA